MPDNKHKRQQAIWNAMTHCNTAYNELIGIHEPKVEEIAEEVFKIRNKISWLLK